MGIPRIAFSEAELKSSIDKFFKDFIIDPQSGKKYHIDEAKPFLALQHEFDHYVMHNATSFALLSFRLNIALHGSLTWLLQTIELKDLSVNYKQKVVNWFHSKGLKKMYKELGLDRPSGLLDLDDDGLKDLADRTSTLSYAGIVVYGSHAIMKLYKCFDATRISVGEFVEVANEVHSYLGYRSRPMKVAKWSTNLHSTESLYPPSFNYSLNDLLEVSAKLEEIIYLLKCGFEPDRINSYLRKMPHRQHQLMTLICNRSGHVVKAKWLIIESLNGFLDAQATNACDTIMVESNYPTWRLFSLVQYCQDIKLEDVNGDANVYVRQLCHLANIPYSGDVIEQYLDAKVNMEGANLPDEVQTFWKFGNTIIFSAEKIRQKALFTILRNLCQRKEGDFMNFQTSPQLLLLKDEMIPANENYLQDLDDKDVMEFVHDLTHYIVSRSLVYGGDVSDLIMLEKSVERFVKEYRIKHKGESLTDFFCKIEDMRSYLKGVLPDQVFKSLKFRSQ